MAKGYKQLSLEERDRITEMKSEGMSLRAIAKELGRSPSTLSREVKRNGTPAYRVYLSPGRMSGQQNARKSLGNVGGSRTSRQSYM